MIQRQSRPFSVPVNIFYRFITVYVVVQTYFCYCAKYICVLLNTPDGKVLHTHIAHAVLVLFYKHTYSSTCELFIDCNFHTHTTHRRNLTKRRLSQFACQSLIFASMGSLIRYVMRKMKIENVKYYCTHYLKGSQLEIAHFWAWPPHYCVSEN